MTTLTLPYRDSHRQSPEPKGGPSLMFWSLSQAGCYVAVLGGMLATGGIMNWTPLDWGAAALFITGGIYAGIRKGRARKEVVKEAAAEGAQTALTVSALPTTPEELVKFKKEIAAEVLAALDARDKKKADAKPSIIT